MQRRTWLAAAGTGVWTAAIAQSGASVGPASAARPGRVLSVGPTRALRTLGAAALVARGGDRVEVDAGDYVGDVASWRHDDLTLVAVGGRVRLRAAGRSAEGKAIWVIAGERVRVAGFDFQDAVVPDGNGAGIRFERGSLEVRDCTFLHNQSGVMASNVRTARLAVYDCEFGLNTRPDGRSHHLYVGTVARLSVRGCYFHHAAVGHLLKSRAAFSEIAYNRLTDETGSASYELDLPSGGVAHVIGNIVAQSADTENRVLISYGAEGYGWPENRLFLVNNTLIDKPGIPGRCLAVRGGAPAHLINNLLVGSRLFFPSEATEIDGNVGINRDDFERETDADFRLRPGSSLVGRFTAPGTDDGRPLAPDREYVHPRSTRALTSPPRNPGAMQTLAISAR